MLRALSCSCSCSCSSLRLACCAFLQLSVATAGGAAAGADSRWPWPHRGDIRAVITLPSATELGPTQGAAAAPPRGPVAALVHCQSGVDKRLNRSWWGCTS